MGTAGRSVGRPAGTREFHRFRWCNFDTYLSHSGTQKRGASSLADPQSAKKRIWSWWNEEMDGQMQYLKEKSWAYHVLTQSNEGLGIIFKFALDFISEFAIERRICVWPNAFHRRWCFVHTEGSTIPNHLGTGRFFWRISPSLFATDWFWSVQKKSIDFVTITAASCFISTTFLCKFAIIIY